MSDTSDFRLLGASEFPNDNPLLHDGAIWACVHPCGPLETIVDPPTDDALAHAARPGAEDPAPVAEPAPSPVAEETSTPIADEPAPEETETSEDPWVPEPTPEPEGIETCVAPVTTTIRPSAPEGFGGLVHALVSISMAAGDMRAAAAMPDLLEEGCIEDGALDPSVEDKLLAAGWIQRREGALSASERLASLVRAWRGVLDNRDFSECGDATLNEWAAELLAAILAGSHTAQALQHQLRRHGVAAFGLVKIAA